MSPTFFGDLAISLSVYIHAVVANMTGGCRRAVDTGSLGALQRHQCIRASRRSTYIFDVGWSCGPHHEAGTSQLSEISELVARPQHHVSTNNT